MLYMVTDEYGSSDEYTNNSTHGEIPDEISLEETMDLNGQIAKFEHSEGFLPVMFSTLDDKPDYNGSYLSDEHKNLRSLYRRRKQYQYKLEQMKTSIRKAHAELRMEGEYKSYKVTREHIKKIVHTVLTEKCTGKGAVRKCQAEFGEEKEWVEKAYRKYLVDKQVRLISDALDSDESEIASEIRSLRLLEFEKGSKGLQFSAYLSKIMKAKSIANTSLSLKAENRKLTDCCTAQADKISELETIIRGMLKCDNLYRVTSCKRAFPDWSYEKIGKYTNLSRQTVSKLLRNAQ